VSDAISRRISRSSNGKRNRRISDDSWLASIERGNCTFKCPAHGLIQVRAITSTGAVLRCGCHLQLRRPDWGFTNSASNYSENGEP